VTGGGGWIRELDRSSGLDKVYSLVRSKPWVHQWPVTGTGISTEGRKKKGRAFWPTRNHSGEPLL